MLTLFLIIGLAGYPQHQPFRQSASPTSGQVSRAPGVNLPNDDEGGGDYNGGGPFTPPTGPPTGLPNDDEGGGDYVGSGPVGDCLYILFLLIFGYGMYRRKQRINEE